MSSAGHLRAQTGATGGDAPTGPKSVVTPECDPFQKNPCVQHKFVTPEIMEEKAYDEKSGLFIEHKLSTQEASELKAKVEKGVEEVKEDVKEENVQRSASDSKGSATGEAVENGEMEGEGETSPLLKEAEKEQKELALKGLGKYEEFISQNKQVLEKHNVHRTIVNHRAEKTSKMVEALKAELEEVKAKEAKLKQEHASITKHTQIARLMAEKKSLDSEIQRHADKLKVLDSEQEQLRKEQVRHINKIDAMKEKLDSLHREILRYKKELGIGESAEVSTVDREEAEVEEAAVSSADEAKKNAGKKALEEAKEEEEEEEEEEENTQATGGATGSATGVALPSNSTGKKA